MTDFNMNVLPAQDDASVVNNAEDAINRNGLAAASVFAVAQAESRRSPICLDWLDSLPSLHQEMNDEANSARFVRLFCRKVIWVEESRTWMIYKDGRWERDGGQVRGLARAVAADIRQQAAQDINNSSNLLKWANTTLQGNHLERMLDGAKSFPRMSVSAAAFDVDKGVLNFTNGTLDLASFAFREHDPDDLLTRRLNYPYDDRATCPRTLQLIRIALGLEDANVPAAERDQRERLVDYLQKCIGYSLTGANDQKVFFFLYGAPNAGKSFILSMISKMADEYHRHVASEALMGRATAGNTPQLATLVGTRLVTTSETEASQSLCQPLMKNLTGRDEVTVTPKYGHPITFLPACVIWLGGNERPRVTGGDQALWNRMRVLPFERSIPEALRRPASELMEAVDAELPGLINWALTGLRNLRDSGFATPELVGTATVTYQDDSNIVRDYIDECAWTNVQLGGGRVRLSNGVPGVPEFVVSHADFYSGYQLWCERSGFKALNKFNLRERMVALGFTNSAYKPNNNTHWGGITLKPEVEVARRVRGSIDHERPGSHGYLNGQHHRLNLEGVA